VNALGAVQSVMTVLLALSGAVFFLAGTVGLVRLPDFYARTHAASKCDSVGAGSLLLALAVYNGWSPGTAKILLLALLLLLASPTTGHALARAAHRSGLVPWMRGDR